MGELRLRIELPGAPEPEVEIWPGDCSIAQMLPRLLAEARDRDKAFSVEGHDWALVLKRTNAVLASDQLLAGVGVVSGDTLVMRDEAAVRARTQGYVSHVSQVVATGFIEPEDVTELARLAGIAQLDAAAQERLLAAASVSPDWVARICAGKPYSPPQLAEYRTALQAAPKDGGVPDDLVRTLAKLRAKHSIDEALHRKLCQRLGLPDRIADKLLEALPPKEDGLAAYRKELEFLKGQHPTTMEELKQLVRLQKQYRISPADHAQLAVELGFTSAQSELLWQGIPPEMAEREASLDAYKTAVRTAWFDQTVTPEEHRNLAVLRIRNKITSLQHLKICKELKMPQEQAEALLKPLAPPGRHYRTMALVAAILLSALGMFFYSQGLRWPALPSLHRASRAARPPSARSDAAPEPREIRVEASPEGGEPAPRPVVGEPILPDPTPVVELGELTIETTPSGVQVFVDGVLKGKTPCKVKAGVGEHRVMLRKRHYAPIAETIGFTKEASVTISRHLERN